MSIFDKELKQAVEAGDFQQWMSILNSNINFSYEEKWIDATSFILGKKFFNHLNESNMTEFLALANRCKINLERFFAGAVHSNKAVVTSSQMGKENVAVDDFWFKLHNAVEVYSHGTFSDQLKKSIYNYYLQQPFYYVSKNAFNSSEAKRLSSGVFVKKLIKHPEEFLKFLQTSDYNLSSPDGWRGASILHDYVFYGQKITPQLVEILKDRFDFQKVNSYKETVLVNLITGNRTDELELIFNVCLDKIDLSFKSCGKTLLHHLILQANKNQENSDSAVHNKKIVDLIIKLATSGANLEIRSGEKDKGMSVWSYIEKRIKDPTLSQTIKSIIVMHQSLQSNNLEAKEESGVRRVRKI